MKNYYQILGVSETCSKKDLRVAYLNLCKQYHPDLNVDNSRNNRIRFQEINEAYNCLIKDEDRQQYDRGLSGEKPNSYEQYYDNKYKGTYGAYDSKEFYERESYRYYEDLRNRRMEEELFRKRMKKPFDENNFYGFRGVRRQPNITIAYICVAIAVFGASIQYLHYKAAEMRMNKARQDSIRLSRSYNHAKKQNATLEAHIKTLEKQIHCQDSKDPACGLD